LDEDAIYSQKRPPDLAILDIRYPKLPRIGGGIETPADHQIVAAHTFQ